MALALVQARGSLNITGGTNGTRNRSFLSSNTAGNLLLVFWAAGPTSLGIGAISTSDTNGNSYVNDFQSTAHLASFDFQYGVFSCRYCKGGANTITVNSSVTTGVGVELVIAEFSGVAAPRIWALDQVASINGTGAPPNSPTINTNAANELLIGELMSSQTPNTGTGYTSLGVSDWADDGAELVGQYNVVTSIGSYFSSATGTAAGDVWGSAILSYYSALPPPLIPLGDMTPGCSVAWKFT